MSIFYRAVARAFPNLQLVDPIKSWVTIFVAVTWVMGPDPKQLWMAGAKNVWKLETKF